MPSGFENEVVIFAGPHGAGKDSLENVFTSMEPEASRHVRYSSRGLTLTEFVLQSIAKESNDDELKKLVAEDLATRKKTGAQPTKSED